MSYSRRRVLAGLVTAAGASGFVFGTSAFSSVTADRDLSLKIVADNNAILALSASGAGKDTDVVTTSDIGVLKIDLPALNTGSTTAIGEFEDSRDFSSPGNLQGEAFAVENQASDPIDVTFSLNGETGGDTGSTDVKVVIASDTPGSDATVTDGSSGEITDLSVNETVFGGILIDAQDTENTSIDLTLDINAQESGTSS